MTDSLRMDEDDEYESPLDKAQYRHKRTSKGWSYETNVVVHRMPGEDGKSWLARSQMALREVRRIAEMERDDRDAMDARRAKP